MLHQGRTHLRSSSSTLFYLLPLLALGVGAIVVYGTASPAPEPQLKTSAARQARAEFDVEMSALPGRVGNLTSEEEEKLRELWKLITQICGVSDEEETPGTETPTSQSKTDTGSLDKGKKDKKLRTLFKKKDKKDKDAETTAAAVLDNVKEDDAEDKYGLNKVFRDTLAERSPESIRKSLWGMIKMDHPDQLLLRFLRARKWDVQKALVMLVSAMKWRQDAKVDDDIMAVGEEHFAIQEKEGDANAKQFAQDFLAQMRMGKSFAHGIDKEGRPINVIRVRLHKGGEQSQESLERYTIYLIELTRMMLQHPVDTGCIIFDMTGFTMANMDYTPIKFMIQTFEANYPESLGTILVHKAPWVFQGVWRIIRGWLDPVVASKVHFTNNVKDMSEFIPKERIAKEMEGDDPWEYQFVEPVPGENAKLKDTATRDQVLAEREGLYEEYESKTLAWVREADAAKRDALKAERNEVAKKLKESYWRLDPYVRARSLYDRVGVIKGNGETDYYPEKSKAAAATASEQLNEKGVNGSSVPAAAAVQTGADDVD